VERLRAQYVELMWGSQTARLFVDERYTRLQNAIDPKNGSLGIAVVEPYLGVL